jgi:hypothetical protein
LRSHHNFAASNVQPLIKSAAQLLKKHKGAPLRPDHDSKAMIVVLNGAAGERACHRFDAPSTVPAYPNG